MMLAPSAFQFGGASFFTASFFSLLIYTLIFGYYTYLRFVRPRRIKDADYQEQKLSEAVEQGTQG